MHGSSTILTFVHFTPPSEPCAELQMRGLFSRPGGTPELQQTSQQTCQLPSSIATCA